MQQSVQAVSPAIHLPHPSGPDTVSAQSAVASLCFSANPAADQVELGRFMRDRGAFPCILLPPMCCLQYLAKMLIF